MCLAKGHNAVTPVRLEPMDLRSRVKLSTTEPLRSRSRRCVKDYQNANFTVKFTLVGQNIKIKVEFT